MRMSVYRVKLRGVIVLAIVINRSDMTSQAGFILFIVYSLLQSCGGVTTTEEPPEGKTNVIPMAVITISILVVAFVIGIFVARFFEYLHTKKSLRDDASDVSEYTQNILKLQYMFTFHRKQATKMQYGIECARRYAKLWRDKAAVVRSRALKASILAEKAKFPPRMKPVDPPATIHEEDEVETTGFKMVQITKQQKEPQPCNNDKVKDETKADAKTETQTDNSKAPVLIKIVTEDDDKKNDSTKNPPNITVVKKDNWMPEDRLKDKKNQTNGGKNKGEIYRKRGSVTSYSSRDDYDFLSNDDQQESETKTDTDKQSEDNGKNSGGSRGGTNKVSPGGNKNKQTTGKSVSRPMTPGLLRPTSGVRRPVSAKARRPSSATVKNTKGSTHKAK